MATTDRAVPHVALTLEVDPARSEFSGTVEYPPEFVRTEGGLDLDGLTIRAVRQGDRSVPFERSADGTRLSLPAVDGGGPVRIDFGGPIEAKSLYGVYRSPHGPGTVLTTHCEPTGARKIFPCVDRPDRKVRIALTVRAPPELSVIANGLPVSTRVVDGRQEWVFEPTPPMSTYLFYLGVGAFEHLDAPGGRTRLRVLAPPGRRDAARWAVETGPKILAACEAYYGIPYPLPKLDLLAIAEHAFGAMENWGAITFQESRLLLDASSTAFSRHDIVETISHEVAHQWFGNLVTMAWWDDIWLNESFAALMETKITEAIAPEFAPWTDFFLRTAGIAAALDGDSLRATHPIRAPVARPEELSQIFDEISYGKGAAVLAMLDRYLGDRVFRAGVKEYLERFRYANARTDDLWASLERASGEPVAALATPWTDRPGLPALTARAVPGGVALEQRRFSYLGPLDDDPWPIPLVVDIHGARRTVRMDTRTATVPAPDGAAVHLNPGAIGFYRVRYDGALFDRLLAALPSSPAADRWSFLSDLGAFVYSGDASWSDYVRASRTLRATDERLVVETMVGMFGGLALDFPDLAPVGRDAREFLAFVTERFGVDGRPGEPAAASILRDRIAFARVRVDPSFASELAPRFERWDTLDANLRGATAIARVIAGGADGYDEVRRALERGGRPSQDALRFARALAWSSEPARIRSVLDLAASGGINRSHVLYVAGQAAANPHGRAVVWEWLQTQLDPLTDMFRGSGYLPLVLEQVVPLAGLGRAGEVRGYFEAHPASEGARGLAKGLERLEILERLRARLVDYR